MANKNTGEFSGQGGLDNGSPYPPMPDPDGIRDVWAIYATDVDDPASDGSDFSKVGLQAPGIGTAGQPE